MDGGFDAGAVGRVEKQNVDLLLQHVFNVGNLLCHVVTGVSYDNIRTDAGGSFFQRFLHGNEIGVVQLLKGHADLELVLGNGRSGDQGQCDGSCKKRQFHVISSLGIIADSTCPFPDGAMPPELVEISGVVSCYSAMTNAFWAANVVRNWDGDIPLNFRKCRLKFERFENPTS